MISLSLLCCVCVCVCDDVDCVDHLCLMCACIIFLHQFIIQLTNAHTNKSIIGNSLCYSSMKLYVITSINTAKLTNYINFFSISPFSDLLCLRYRVVSTVLGSAAPGYGI